MDVEGTLIATGNEADSIVFTRQDTLGFHTVSDTAGGWHGIHFDNSGNLLWKTKVWGCGSGVIAGVSGPTNLEISTFDGRVFLFGSGSLEEVFAEVFDIESGANCFRFSRCYWKMLPLWQEIQQNSWQKCFRDE